LLFQALNLVLQLLLLILIRLDESLKLLTMLVFVLNLASELEDHIFDLLHSRLKRTQCDLSFLMLPESLQFLVCLLILKPFKLQSKAKFLFSLPVQKIDFEIEGWTILLRPIILAY